MKDESATWLIVVLVVFGVIAAFICGMGHARDMMIKEAVKHHAARYNPETGDFQWLDEINKHQAETP